MRVYRFVPVPSWKQRLWERYFRRRLGACGERVILSMSGSYTWPNISLGNDVHVGTRSILWATKSRIVIGDKVVMGPEVMMFGGDHHTGLKARFIYDIGEHEVFPGDDQDIVLDGDNWVGARAILLKGVRVGRGTVIAAAAVVTKSLPPYCIAGGNPARALRLRGSVDEILAHERELYPLSSRLTRDTIEAAEQALARPRRAT
jgi:acetyltransferase-like isoleucine patch superfamily enzyme